jgi:hypothetical protein
MELGELGPLALAENGIEVPRDASTRATAFETRAALRAS